MISVVTSPIELEVGKIYSEKETGLTFEEPNNIYYNYRFLVLGVASKEDYINFVTNEFPEIKPGERFVTHKFFYKISQD